MRVFTTSVIFVVVTFVVLSSFAAPQDERGNTTGPMSHEAYDQAIAPYVAKARATYPAAKKRYLAGLATELSVLRVDTLVSVRRQGAERTR